MSEKVKLAVLVSLSRTWRVRTCLWEIS